MPLTCARSRMRYRIGCSRKASSTTSARLFLSTWTMEPKKRPSGRERAESVLSDYWLKRNHSRSYTLDNPAMNFRDPMVQTTSIPVATARFWTVRCRNPNSRPHYCRYLPAHLFGHGSSAMTLVGNFAVLLFWERKWKQGPMQFEQLMLSMHRCARVLGTCAGSAREPWVFWAEILHDDCESCLQCLSKVSQLL